MLQCKTAALPSCARAYEKPAITTLSSTHGKRDLWKATDLQSSFDLLSCKAGAGGAIAEVVHVGALGGGGKGGNHGLLCLLHALPRQVQLAPVSRDQLPLVLCHLVLQSLQPCEGWLQQ